jgi:hypothetical protein
MLDTAKVITELDKGGVPGRQRHAGDDTLRGEVKKVVTRQLKASSRSCAVR